MMVMSGNLFDNLNKKLAERQRDEGISPLDLSLLSPRLRRLVRLLIREVEMSDAELQRAMATLPEQERLSQQELEHALQQLHERAWLLRRGQAGRTLYRVNFRRRPGSQLGDSLWDRINARLNG